MFNISEATKGDIPAIIEIAEKTWWPTYSEFISADQIRYMLDTIYAPEILRKQMVNGIQTFLLLKDENGPQAFASFGLRSEEPHVYKVHKLYVHPQTQGKSYGKMLIQEIKNQLLKKNIHILDLNVNRFNPARRFYEKTGFVILREEDIPIGPYWMNDFVMRMTF